LSFHSDLFAYRESKGRLVPADSFHNDQGTPGGSMAGKAYDWRFPWLIVFLLEIKSPLDLTIQRA